MKNKNKIWLNRKLRFQPLLDKLPRRLREDFKLLLKVFLIRKSLRLILTNNYLAKVWECHSSTVKNRLNKFYELGLLKKLLKDPKKKADGSFSQERTLLLIIPKDEDSSLREENSSLVDKNDQLPNKQVKPAVNLFNHAGRRKTPLSFLDYLRLQTKVSQGSFAFFLKQNGVRKETMGYLLTTIHKRIKNRPDLLETLLCEAERLQLHREKLIGYLVNEIKARTIEEYPGSSTARPLIEQAPTLSKAAQAFLAKHQANYQGAS